ncbi:glycosyltransferase [Myxococcota bacterium]
MVRLFRLAIVASHPIQYMAPWYCALAADPAVELTVFFASQHGQQEDHDAGFGTAFRWARPLTEGYRHEFLPGVHPRSGPYGFWHLTNPSLWQRIHATRFDAVVAPGWAFASAWLSIAAARAHGVRVLLRGESHDGSQAPRPLWKRTARRAILGGLFRHVDAFLAIGSRNAEFYRSFGVPSERIYTTPYAVDNAFFSARRERLLPRRQELRRALGVEDERPVIVCSGKLIERKAPLDLVRAFARVRSEVPSKLVFLGEGPLRSSVEALSSDLGIRDDVHVTGFRQQDAMCDVYVASDLMVFPSHFDTWGLVLNEGMLFGLPVVCSSGVTSHYDLVLEGRTGHVYTAGDINALSAVLQQRLVDANGTRKMGESARQRVLGWGYERGVQATVEALRYVCRAQGSA